MTSTRSEIGRASRNDSSRRHGAAALAVTIILALAIVTLAGCAPPHICTQVSGSSTSCGSAGCIELAIDPEHCGACDHRCGPGFSCANSSCECRATICGTACVDLGTDTRNCGACGMTCAAGAACVAGRCTCPNHGLVCNGGCVDVVADPINCGACGNRCCVGGPGRCRSCVSGACACVDGTTDCGPAAGCVDLMRDRFNCGACGRICALDGACVAGVCASRRCLTDRDCADGESCDRAFPGGLCSRRCTSNDECAPGVCDAGRCSVSCRLQPQRCVDLRGACGARPSGTGLLLDWCVPACFESGPDPAGMPGCAADQACNPWSGRCEDRASVPPAGADNGAPCARQTDCRSGLCATESDVPDGAGFIDGMCVSLGRMPDRLLFLDGEPIPRSNCPPGSGVVWDVPEGRTSLCFPTCTLGRPGCREGYACRPLRLSTFAYTSSDGFCYPIDCGAGAACPAGYSCGPGGDRWPEMSLRGACVRAISGPPDAASMDASSD